MSSDDSFGRLMSVSGCRTQAELASFIGVSQSAVAYVYRRGRLPASWLLAAFRQLRVNPEWILYGDGYARFLTDLPYKNSI